MAKAAAGKSKRKVFYTVGHDVHQQYKVAGRGLTKKQRRGQVTAQV